MSDPGSDGLVIAYRRDLQYWTPSNPNTSNPRIGVPLYGQPGDPL